MEKNTTTSNMKKTITIIALLITLGVSAQTEISNYKPGVDKEGVTYYLPKTLVKIKVNTTLENYTPGEFSKYAERYLRLEGIDTEAHSEWKMNNIQVGVIGVPDPNKIFTVKLKERTTAPLVTLTDDGILQAINASVMKKQPQPEKKQEATPRYNSKNFLTEEILMAGSTAKMAELTAKEIYNIRDSRNSILRGQADSMPKDGDSMKFMVAQLDKQEAALMQLFTGYTEIIDKSFDLNITPTDSLPHQVLFRFSKKLGVLDNSNLAGEPIYIDIQNEKTVPQPTIEEKNKKRLSGIVYNLPGKASVKVYQGKKIFYQGELDLTQFGNTEILDNDLFNKKMTTKVTFDSDTGAVLKIDAEMPQSK